MTQILSTTNVAKQVNATTKDDKYNYSVDYNICNNNKVLQKLSIRVDSLVDNSYVGTVTLTVETGDRSYAVKESADLTVIGAMSDAIIAEVKSLLTV